MSSLLALPGPARDHSLESLQDHPATLPPGPPPRVNIWGKRGAVPFATRRDTKGTKTNRNEYTKDENPLTHQQVGGYMLG